MMPFAIFEQQASTIPYQYRHSRFLHALIRWLRPKSVVEVGSHIGMSAVWMARALQENGEGGRLYCIDNFCWTDQPNQERDWNANIDRCGVRDVVTLIKGRSQEVEWPARVDFAYIDGNHTKEVCNWDVHKSFRHEATCIVLNDTVTCEGARQVGDEIHHLFNLYNGVGWGFLEVNFDAGLLIALKNEPKPPVQQGDYDQWDR